MMVKQDKVGLLTGNREDYEHQKALSIRNTKIKVRQTKQK